MEGNRFERSEISHNPERREGKSSLRKLEWQRIRFVLACLMMGYSLEQMQTLAKFLGNAVLMSMSSLDYYNGLEILLPRDGLRKHLRGFGFEPTGATAIEVDSALAYHVFWAARQEAWTINGGRTEKTTFEFNGIPVVDRELSRIVKVAIEATYNDRFNVSVRLLELPDDVLHPNTATEQI